MMSFVRNTVLGAATAATLAIGGAAQGAYVIATPGAPVIENFTSYAGSAAPTNWTITGSSAPGFQNQSTGSGTAGGIYSYGATSSSERALGYLGNSSTAASVAYTAAYTNNTGDTLIQLDISFRAEQWRLASGGRTNGWEVSLSTDGVNYTVINDLSTWTSTNSGTTGAVDGNSATYSASLAATVSSLSIANGSNFSIRFAADRGSGSGSSQGIAIDDVSVTGTVIPEPASLALLGLGGLLMLGRGRRA